MERRTLAPRPNWRDRVESQGMHFHTSGPETYWDESAHYVLTTREADEIERATVALNDMCLAAVQHVIDEERFAEFDIPPRFVKFIEDSWERDEVTVYGRFDLVYDGRRPPQLLEYNADTPTSLLEASVVQWHWFKESADRMPPGAYDQFNSLHERLIEAWRRAKSAIAEDRPDAVLHVASVGIDTSVEDFITAEYLRDVALQAGWKTVPLTMSEIGWESRRKRFIDPSGANIDFLFKLYPWEWMIREGFAGQLLEGPTRWFEPPWKMLLSNKALLAVLYELHPDSPYLLPAGFEPLGPTYVRKPLLSREGANIAIVHDGKTMLETEGEYDSDRCVYQEFRPLPNFDGNYTVVGSWMVNGYPAGVGFREDRTLITGNMSRFLPHVIGG